MQISAGILFVKDGSLFMGHATETPHWDIPKGHVEKDESYINAAIRECYEETGVIVHDFELSPFGLLEYTNKKSLALFLYIGDNLPDPEHAVCTSTFVKDGRTITEMDDFKYVPFSEIKVHARKSMVALLEKLL